MDTQTAEDAAVRAMVRHRDVQQGSECGGQVAEARELFRVDYWCVYCGAKFDWERGN